MATLLLPISLLLCTAAAPAAQCDEILLLGDGAGDQFGDLVAPAGDVDADGVPDLAVRTRSLPAEVRVRSGATGAEILRLTGGSSGFGSAIAAIGDWDGDGHDDLALGDPWATPGALTSAGRVLIYSGSSGAELLRVDGAQAFGNFGASLASLGDLDHDGIAEIAVGEPGNDFNGGQNGAAHLLSGATGATLRTWYGDVRDNLGNSLDAAGDADGDGVTDLVVGAAREDEPGFNSGGAYIFSGDTGVELAHFEGFETDDAFGTTVRGVGDWNGDGLDDVAVGAPGFSDFGAVFIHTAGSPVSVGYLRSETLGNGFGAVFDAGQDLDGDGTPDVVVGEPGASGAAHRSGAATVFQGGTGIILRRFAGQNAFDALGSSVALLPDHDGDGIATTALGILLEDTRATDAGAVLVADCPGFRLTAPAPGIAGAANVLAAWEATPGAAVHFLWSGQVGSTPLPGGCGQSADLNRAQLAGTAAADALGVARLSAFVPASASGRLLVLQAWEPSTCRLTQALLHRFP